MRQFVARKGERVRDLLLSVADLRVRRAAKKLDAAEAAMQAGGDTAAQMAYADASARLGARAARSSTASVT